MAISTKVFRRKSERWMGTSAGEPPGGFIKQRAARRMAAPSTGTRWGNLFIKDTILSIIDLEQVSF